MSGLILGRVALDARGVINGSGHSWSGHPCQQSLRSDKYFTTQVRGHVMTGGINIMQPSRWLYHPDW